MPKADARVQRTRQSLHFAFTPGMCRLVTNVFLDTSLFPGDSGWQNKVKQICRSLF
jgi:hypothetical protein